MSDGKRYPRDEALALANELCLSLAKGCERIVVAGSLRRMKPTVGDVEILFIPKFEQSGLFEADRENIAERLIKAMLDERFLEPRPNIRSVISWGALNKLARHRESGIPVDLFTVPKKDRWWNSVVCRTGGKDNNLLITTTAQKRGWTWNAYGSGFTNLTTGETYQTKSEQDVYEFLGLPYLEPCERK